VFSLLTWGLRVPPNVARAEGIIRNMNTIEAFKEADRAAIIHTAGRQVYLLFHLDMHDLYSAHMSYRFGRLSKMGQSTLFRLFSHPLLSYPMPILRNTDSDTSLHFQFYIPIPYGNRLVLFRP
jgi:hypothetical protein